MILLNKTIYRDDSVKDKDTARENGCDFMEINMNIYQIIANTIMALLKAKYPNMDIFMEQIPKINNDKESDCSEDYFFLEIVPISNTMFGALQVMRSVFINIACHISSESNKEYLQMADEIDGVLRPILCFEGRAITIPNANISIVDKVLHYSFTIGFVDGNEPSPADLMMELNLDERVD